MNRMVRQDGDAKQVNGDTEVAKAQGFLLWPQDIGVSLF